MNLRALIGIVCASSVVRYDPTAILHSVPPSLGPGTRIDTFRLQIFDGLVGVLFATFRADEDKPVLRIDTGDHPPHLLLLFDLIVLAEDGIRRFVGVCRADVSFDGIACPAVVYPIRNACMASKCATKVEY